ncbi:cytochrome P450 [Bradyrhizobium sp. U87765 SZCCT0131]|uniref:cytochrome P450 n=1 Tax=unclassified Bradyrhizobium TaxID=2631580 RepID=UPI001BAA98BB|nr:MULTISPECIES: cytochrome P450 [unclassified Bradyrhizobium]MBR1222562.1 cytochrome P450 [Bradyrhizobium sp. U87765 SZCCT0131]MBR1265357.1 cytochrome P450 [Bradyrhizobium sp. U87765 SZCCT0134]MBR1302864.1 cytochrome P450 [Bradyrhizobium sp. U87765 SZCCT0110]MBR1323562.1 cytochrome P450 [Bradyrhizobium sp. U87765 SZCCT0109]MBR1346793.1 cytochrome P450 [Bradyrhizobium sp. U87765 SZCCT0048]
MAATTSSPTPSTGARPPSAAIPRLDIDPFSIAYFDDPFPAQEALRDAGPVVYLDTWNVHAVARYNEVHAVLNDPQTFCSSRGVGLSDFAREKPWRPPSLILEADPPAHTRTRAVLNRVLSPAVMKQIRDSFAAAAEAKADELVARGSFDAIADFAEAYPLSVFPDALGLKQDGREHLLPYAGLVFNAFGPPNELRQTAIERSAPHQAYVQEQCQRENLAPGGFGACIHARVDVGDITAAEAPLLVRSLLSAGLDTTVNGLGAAIYCLARFPDQWARLRADPSLARNAFEEAVRLESPVQTFFRTTTRDVELGGLTIGEGEKVLMFLGAANRDPRRWDAPDSYDITRRTSGHVGFGGGIHMCVGQLVARLEGEVMLSALARRVATIEITGPVTRRYNNTLRGLEHLPVTFKPA